MSWLPQKHQKQGAIVAAADLMVEGWHYMSWEERTGKTITALLAMQKAGFKNVLVVTKKNAVPGWEEAIYELGGMLHIKFHIMNYHQVGTAKRPRTGTKVSIDLKIDRDAYDGVILDEAHNYISGSPKPSNMYYVIKTAIYDKKVLYLSATPHAQGYQLMFHQMKVCTYTPWQEYDNFYVWFKEYGIANPQYIGSRTIEQYNLTHEDKVLQDIDFGFSFMTRAEVGMKHEPHDVLHYVTLDEDTKRVYNEVQRDKVFEYEGFIVPIDSTMKERTTLHMIEGGVFIMPNGTRREYFTMNNKEKVDYILDKWGDTPDLVIMYNYKAEKLKLEQNFKKAQLLQATSNAEGVDLHEFETLVIYSQDWSTFRHSQRRARQANIKREQTIDVHFLLVKGGLSEQVYNTVSINKANFVDKRFREHELK